MGVVHDEMKKLRSDGSNCTLDCRAMLLGLMHMQLHILSLFDPCPTHPFLGRSFTATADAVQRIETPEVTWGERGHNHKPHSTLEDLFVGKIDDLRLAIKGLDLDEELPEVSGVEH